MLLLLWLAFQIHVSLCCCDLTAGSGMNAIDSCQCLCRDARVSEHVENKRYCLLQSCVPSLAMQFEFSWSEIFIVYMQPGSDQTALNVHLITFKNAQPQQCYCCCACLSESTFLSLMWFDSMLRYERHRQLSMPSSRYQSVWTCWEQEILPSSELWASLALQCELPWSEIFIVSM